jgi:hypothetical protein
MAGIMPPLCNEAVTREAKNSRLRLGFSNLWKIAAHVAVPGAGLWLLLPALARRASQAASVM